MSVIFELHGNQNLVYRLADSAEDFGEKARRKETTRKT
jgi:hypothetical protein